MYKALIKFIDAETLREYSIGDEFDVTGMTDERIHELTTENNRIGVPLICEVEETETTETTETFTTMKSEVFE